MSAGVLELHPERAFLRRLDNLAIRELPGFVRGRHRIPSELGVPAERFIHELGKLAIADEIATLYANAKRELGLRRRDLVQASADGGGNVDTPLFRYLIELAQDRCDPARAIWRRELRLLVEPGELPAEFDAMFPVALDELVVPFSGEGLTRAELFDLVVDRLEDFAEHAGGQVEEHEREGRARLVDREGSEIEFDLERGSLGVRVRGCEGALALLDAAKLRFPDLA
ncbi:hypothetical protein ACNOYE_15310 [Nannocystaceae bacterium ST9]